MAKQTQQRKRRPHGELKSAMREFLASRKGQPASMGLSR